jgi:alpha/beta superfamily hydrolase
VLLGNGVDTLRFNFRGAGGSDGRHDNGAGEVEDLQAAIAWLQTEHGSGPLWLGGYSFGAYVVWQSLDRVPPPARVLLIAPPVGMMAFPPRQPGCPVDVFVGDADDFADLDALAAWEGITRHVLAGANHFFVGQSDVLKRRIEQAIC